MSPEDQSTPAPDEAAEAPTLSGAERRYLRGIASTERPVVWIGGEGLSAGAIQSVREALDARELIKVRLRTPDDKKGTARDLAKRSGAALCGLIGHTVILYRPGPDPERRRIQLPEGSGAAGAAAAATRSQ